MDQGARQERRHLAGVVLRHDLDQVEAHEFDAGQSPDEAERVAAGWPAHLRRPRAWSETWIDGIDVEAQEDGARADELLHFRQNVIDAPLQELLGRDQVKAQRPRTTTVL